MAVGMPAFAIFFTFAWKGLMNFTLLRYSLVPCVATINRQHELHADHQKQLHSILSRARLRVGSSKQSNSAGAGAGAGAGAEAGFGIDAQLQHQREAKAAAEDGTGDQSWGLLNQQNLHKLDKVERKSVNFGPDAGFHSPHQYQESPLSTDANGPSRLRMRSNTLESLGSRGSEYFDANDDDFSEGEAEDEGVSQDEGSMSTGVNRLPPRVLARGTTFSDKFAVL
jgi:hypothetical protein